MKIILQVNAATEILAGFIILFNPEVLLMNSTPEIHTIAVSKLYGMLAFCFGLISYILSRHFEYSIMYKQIILTLIAFHFAVGLYMYNLFSQFITPNPGAFCLHLILSVLFLTVYLTSLNKFTS